VTGVDDESSRSVTVKAITAAAEHPDGRIQLNIEVDQVQPASAGGDQSGDSWFFQKLTGHIAQALNLRGIGSMGSTIHVAVARDQLEQSVRTIRTAVAAFHLLYPSLLAERRSEAERREVESAAKQDRLEADQTVIDRVMQE
jgi:hypothetical protein